MNSRRLWIPDTGCVCAALTLGYCLFLYDGWRQLFRDSDTGWHIRAGEAILARLELPRTDPYSFTRPGQPWFAWEWAADALTALAHRGAGLAGVAALYAVVAAAVTWVWWRLTWIVGGDFLLGWLFSAPMLSTATVHWLARPHMFGWLFAMLALWIAERAPRRITVRSMVPVALLAVAWTNFHASFFLLPVMLLLYCFGEWAAGICFENPPGGEVRRGWFAVAALVAAVATLANPYGWRVHEHVFRYLGDSELIDRIAEFQSFNFHVAGATQILAALGIAAFGGVLALLQGRVTHYLIATLFVAIGLRSARGLPLVALLLLPLANGAITRGLRNVTKLREPVLRRLRAGLQYSAALRGFDEHFAGWALMPLAAGVVLMLARTATIQAHAGFPPSEFPVAAANVVEMLPADARILAPDSYGGYLIYRFNGQRKVFFDGRSDFYGAAFMKNYIQLVEVRPNWQDELAKYPFTYALLPNRYSLIPALEREGWRRLYNDEIATVLAR